MTGITEQATRTDLLFKALASGVRREIIATLATRSCGGNERCCDDEVCACTFTEQLDLGAPTVSHHMRILQDAGLVIAEKRGLWVYYRLAPAALADVADAVEGLGLGRCGEVPSVSSSGT